VPGQGLVLGGQALGNLSNTALLAQFDEHWEALAQALSGCPRYVELGSAGIIVYEAPA
jgi:hypothetical protein